MYLEFFLLITDYFRTISKRIFLFEWVLPLLIGIGVFLSLYLGATSNVTTLFKDNAINLMGILVGFSITIITILTTSQGTNIDLIKETLTEIKINNKTISLYRLLLINFTYSVIIEIGIIIVCLIYPFIIGSIEINPIVKYVGFSILVVFIMHIMLLTIRNLTDFYLILTKPKQT